jgi:hypothetical protein
LRRSIEPPPPGWLGPLEKAVKGARYEQGHLTHRGFSGRRRDLGRSPPSRVHFHHLTRGTRGAGVDRARKRSVHCKAGM